MNDHLAEILGIEPLTIDQLEDINSFIENIKKNNDLFIENQKGSKNNHYGYKHSEETKKLLSEKAKLRPKIYGRQHTEESKRKISESKRGIRPNRDYSNPWNKGLKLGPRNNGI